MSVSIQWRVLRNDSKSLPGTSNDWQVFDNIFGRRPLQERDIPMLEAMHAASGLKESLWGALAEVLRDGCEIEVFAEW